MTTRAGPVKASGPIRLELDRHDFQAVMTGMRRHLVTDAAEPAFEVGDIVNLLPEGHEDGVPYLQVRITSVDTFVAIAAEVERPLAVLSFSMGFGWGRPAWSAES